MRASVQPADAHDAQVSRANLPRSDTQRADGLLNARADSGSAFSSSAGPRSQWPSDASANSRASAAPAAVHASVPAGASIAQYARSSSRTGRDGEVYPHSAPTSDAPDFAANTHSAAHANNAPSSAAPDADRGAGLLAGRDEDTDNAESPVLLSDALLDASAPPQADAPDAFAAKPWEAPAPAFAPSPTEQTVLRFIHDSIKAGRYEDLDEADEEAQSFEERQEQDTARGRNAVALAAQNAVALVRSSRGLAPAAAPSPATQADTRTAAAAAPARPASPLSTNTTRTPSTAPVPAPKPAAVRTTTVVQQPPVRAYVRVERRGAFDDLREVRDAVVPPRRAIASILPSDAHVAAALTLAYTLRKGGNALPLVLFHMAHDPPSVAVRNAVMRAGWDLRPLKRVEPFFKDVIERYQDACVVVHLSTHVYTALHLVNRSAL